MEMRRQVDLDGYSTLPLRKLAGPKTAVRSVWPNKPPDGEAADSVDFGPLFVQKLLRKLPIKLSRRDSAWGWGLTGIVEQ